MRAISRLCVTINTDVVRLVRLLVQQLENLDAGAEVQLARGLVGQQDRIAGGDGARDRDALLLAPGQLVREVLEAIAEPDAFERRGRHSARVAVAAGHVHAELDVLERGQRREEVERLEDEADAVAAEAKQLLARGLRDVLPGDHDGPAVGESSAPIMFRRVVLPLPEGPSTTMNSPSAMLERHVVERRDRHVAELVAARDSVQLDDGRNPARFGAAYRAFACHRVSLSPSERHGAKAAWRSVETAG